MSIPSMFRAMTERRNNREYLRALFPHLETSHDTIQITHAQKSTPWPGFNNTPVVEQPDSPLLSLPAEVRLIIASHIDLSLETVDYLGAYYTFRQLQADMWNQLQPARDLSKLINDNRSAWSHGHEPTIKFGPLHPQLRLLRNVTITVLVPNNRIGGLCCQKTLADLYSLYLNSLNVVMTGRTGYRPLPNGDMKSWPPEYFIGFVVNGKLNCKKIRLQSGSDG
jgi:hypothetical protein